MKSYAGEVEVRHVTTIPGGRKFPRAPKPFEMFHLEADQPDEDENGHKVLPWHARGTYIYDGLNWLQLNAIKRQTQSELISAQSIEIERPGVVKEMPHPTQGQRICAVMIQPTNRKARISGHATMFVHATKAANIWVSVFQGTRFVSAGAAFVEPGKVQNLSLSFVDIPHSNVTQTYFMMLNADTICEVEVNRTTRLLFDGGISTAFTVTENT